MVSTLDFRRFLPGIVPQDIGMFTGGTASGPGSFSVPVQADGAAQQVPPPAEPEKYGPTNPTGKPPVMAGVGGATTLSPMGTTSTVTPPVTPAGLKEVYGPGASQSSVTQAPTKPIEPAFNPDVREAVRGAVAAQAAGTPAVQAGNIYDKLMKLQEEGKLGPMVSALAKMGGGGKGPAPPPAWHSTLQGGNPGYHPGNPGSAAQVMQGLTGGAEKREEARKKKPRRNERDRYDILAGRG
jgi:hypothetical protein